jgi:mRNA interferase MazF
LSAVTVAVITGTEGPPSTHVAVDSDVGLTGHEVSYINATDLQTVDKPRLRRRRGLLSPGDVARLEDAIRLYLGL